MVIKNTFSNEYNSTFYYTTKYANSFITNKLLNEIHEKSQCFEILEQDIFQNARKTPRNLYQFAIL